MRLVVLTHNNPFFISSASANRLRSLIEGLQSRDIEITLLITGGYLSKQEQTMLGHAGNYQNITYKYLSKVLINSVWKKRWDSYIGKYLRSSVLYKILIQLGTKKDLVIWVPKDYMIWKLIHKIKKENPSIILLCEMNEFLDIHHSNKGNFLHRWRGDKTKRFFEKKFIYMLDGLVLMTKTLLNHYQQFRGNLPHMMHLPMTVDLTRFDKILPPVKGFTKPYIVYVGVMNDAKDGVNILIKAYKKIYPDIKEYQLYLVGPWHYDTPLHLKMIQEFGLVNKIEWKGAYDRDLIPAIIQNADLLVLPRPDSKQAQGGFPTKLGEYLATGNPVVATRVGELPDYLKDGNSVFFAEPGSVSSLGKTMKRALSDKEEASKVGIKGLEVAQKNFNSVHQAEELYNFIKTL